MKRHILPILLSVWAVLSCNEKPEETPFVQATHINLSSGRFIATNSSDSQTVRVDADGDWTVECDAQWIRIERNEEEFVMSICGPLSNNEERNATVRVSSGKKEETIPVILKKACLLDIVFNTDGTASDVSSQNRPIQSNIGGYCAVYWDEGLGRNVAHFSHESSSAASGGYYRYDYSGDAGFVSRVSDGYSIEALLSVGNAPGQVPMYAAASISGTSGIGLGINPGQTLPAGQYSHIVSVWDKNRNESRLYINGELVRTEPCTAMSLPAASALKWVCIGGNCSKSGASNAWNGDIAALSIHDAVFDLEEVRYRFGQLPKSSPSAISISGVAFLKEFATVSGGTFAISGKGFRSGDKLVFTPLGSKQGIECTADSDSKKAAVKLPSGLTDGNYVLSVKRAGEKDLALGTVKLVFTDPSATSRKPKIIAHRGVHNTGAPENSIAALKLAQQGRYYGSEMDVWLTTDDSLMVNHDGKISGYTIEQQNYRTMRGVKLANGEVLPTLGEFLTQTRQSSSTKLIIEIKDHSNESRTLIAAQKAVEMVKRMKLEASVEYIAFSWKACLKIRELDKDAVIGYLSGDRDPSTLKTNGINTMDYSYSSILNNHPGWIADGHKLGIETNIWTVNDNASMVECIAKCADYITTDYPETVQSLADTFFPEN